MKKDICIQTNEEIDKTLMDKKGERERERTRECEIVEWHESSSFRGCQRNRFSVNGNELIAVTCCVNNC